MNRKGDLEMWTQLFFIAFFVLILVVALVMLTIDRKRLQDERPELGKDIADQRAQQLLISLLRTQVQTGEKSMPFADVIVFNERGGPDLLYEQVNDSLRQIVPADTYFTLTVHYSNGGSFSIENSEIIASHLGEVGRGAAVLPGSSGNANIVLLMATGTQCKERGWACTAKPLDLRPLGRLPRPENPATAAPENPVTAEDVERQRQLEEERQRLLDRQRGSIQ